MGATGFGAGMVPEEGFHFGQLYWLTEFSSDQDFTQGTNRVQDLDVDIFLTAAGIPTYTHDIEPLGARLKALAFVPFVWIDGTFTVANAPNESEHKDAQLGDIGFEVALGWQEKDIFGIQGLQFDYTPGLLVVAPTGHYEQQEVLNAGRHRWLIQPHFSYTLFHEGTGLEVSQRIMYGFNTTNGRTNYRSGQEFHFDWAVGHRFDFGMTLGMFGFWYRQTTADGGRGATVGDLKGKSWGFGPAIQYSSEVFGVPVTGAVRYQKVMQHRNRLDDDSFFFQLVVNF